MFDNSRLYANMWGSITVFTQKIIADLNVQEPDLNLQFHDWEAHSNTPELPEAHLLGPSGMTITEYEEEVEVTFAIGASTYEGDDHLFLLRGIMGEVFERMRPQSRIRYFDAGQATEKSVLVITPGTLLAPMSRPSARPWQYVQASALLVPA